MYKHKEIDLISENITNKDLEIFLRFCDRNELKELRVSHNKKLTKLPKFINEFKNLEILSISFCKNFKSLGNLEGNDKLIISAEHSGLEDLGKLKKVKTLWLNHTKITEEYIKTNHPKFIDKCD